MAATRMYRGLDDFLSSDMYDDHIFLSSLLCSPREKCHRSLNVSSKKGGHPTSISGTWDTPARAIPLPRIDVEVNTVHSHSLTSQVTSHTGSLVSNMDTQVHDKSHKLV